MNKTIITIAAIFFCLSFYSFVFSGAKGASENIKDDVQVTSVDRYCKQQKGECDL